MNNNGFTIVEKETKNVRAAKNALKCCLSIIKQRIRFLGPAVNIFEVVPVKEKTELITDGKHLFFHAETVLEEYKIYGIHYLIRKLLHMVLHGVFGDFELREEKEWQGLRSAVMDLRVDRMMELLGYGTDRQIYQGIMYRPGLYLLGRKNKKEQKNIIKNSEYCRLDDHRLWTKQRKYQSERSLEEVKKLWGDVREKLGLERSPEGQEEVKGRMIGSLTKMICGQRGNDRGISMKLGKAEAGESKDYAHVLAQMFQQAEVVKEEDTLDANLYLYGLDCYGDVALVEPMEVAEKVQMNTLALAVDTSGSCLELIPEFLRETVAVLRQADSLTAKGRVAYMECDAEITKEMLFDSFSDAVKKLEEHQAAGGGGTNFCPVFERIEQFKKAGQIIDALFYFSDGDGMFPEKEPDYPVYFVMKQERGMSLSEMPIWVKCIQL